MTATIPTPGVSALTLEEQQALATDPNTQAGTLLALVWPEEADLYIAAAVAAHRNAPQEALIALSSDDSITVLMKLLENPNTPTEAVTAIHAAGYAIGEPELEAPEHAAAGHVNFSFDALQEAKERIDAARDPRTPVRKLAILATTTERYTRKFVGRNPSASEAILRDLATDSDPMVRRAVAGNHATPIDVLVTLSADDNVDVQEAVARNPSTPAETLASMTTSVAWDVRCAAAENPTTPEAALTALEEREDDWAVRASIAGNVRAPQALLALMGPKDTDWDVRRALAGNPRTPAETLAYLLTLEAVDERDMDEVRERIAGNVSTPDYILTILSEWDGDWTVRAAVAGNVGARQDLLAVMARTNKDWRVLAALAGNVTTPAETLAYLLTIDGVNGRKGDWVRDRIASNPSSPDDALESLIDSGREPECSIAKGTLRARKMAEAARQRPPLQPAADRTGPVPGM